MSAQWEWCMNGVSPLSSPGARRRVAEESGVVDADGAVEAIHWLVHHGPWETFDQTQGVVIDVYPAYPYRADDGA